MLFSAKLVGGMKRVDEHKALVPSNGAINHNVLGFTLWNPSSWLNLIHYYILRKINGLALVGKILHPKATVKCELQRWPEWLPPHSRLLSTVSRALGYVLSSPEHTSSLFLNFPGVLQKDCMWGETLLQNDWNGSSQAMIIWFQSITEPNDLLLTAGMGLKLDKSSW